MKKLILQFRNSNWSKVLACCMIVTVLVSMFAISSSASESTSSSDDLFVTLNFTYDIVSVSEGVSTQIFAFYPSSSKGGIKLYSSVSGSVVTTLNLNDYSSYIDLDSMSFMVYVSGPFDWFWIDNNYYEGQLSSDIVIYDVPAKDSGSYEFYAESGDVAVNTSVRRWFAFRFSALSSEANDYYALGFADGVNSDTAKNKWYPQGFNSGVLSTEAKEYWYPQGYDEGYRKGLSEGLNSSGSSSFGQNLIGDTLSAPFEALDSFTLFVAPSGTEVTLGMVFGGMIALMLFLGFLKMFAGG